MFIKSNRYIIQIIHFTFAIDFNIYKDNLTAWKYSNSIKSSVTILGGSLQSNRTYQFMVYMESRRNSSAQATGYVLVKVEDTRSQMIAIG
jgi:hypothetical protein